MSYLLGNSVFWKAYEKYMGVWLDERKQTVRVNV
jgi:hypothetical protein